MTRRRRTLLALCLLAASAAAHAESWVGLLGGNAGTAGLMILGGGVMRFSQHFMLFGEWRMQDLTFRYSALGDSVNIPVKVSEFVLGAAYWY